MMELLAFLYTESNVILDSKKLNLCPTWKMRTPKERSFASCLVVGCMYTWYF